MTDEIKFRGKMPMIVGPSDNDILMGAMVRYFMEQNNGAGYYTEVVKVIKETPKTYVVEFRGKQHTLKKFTRGGLPMSVWDTWDDSIHFKLLDTPVRMYRFLKDHIRFLTNKVESHMIDEAAEKGKGEWMPVEEEV